MSRLSASKVTADSALTNQSVRDSLATDLDALLNDLTTAHESWLAAMHDHRQAVRTADPGAMQASLDRQAACVSRIAGLEDRRRAVVDRAARLPDFASSTARPRQGPLTLRELATATAEPARSRLLQHADRLRTLIADVRRSGSILQAASASLLAHTEGLMRQVARRLSHAGTYGRHGFVESAPGMACAVDLLH